MCALSCVLRDCNVPETSKGGFSPLAGAYADHFFEGCYKDLAIAYFPGPRALGDRLQNPGNQLVGRQDRDLYLRQEVDRIINAAGADGRSWDALRHFGLLV